MLHSALHCNMLCTYVHATTDLTTCFYRCTIMCLVLGVDIMPVVMSLIPLDPTSGMLAATECLMQVDACMPDHADGDMSQPHVGFTATEPSSPHDPHGMTCSHSSVDAASRMPCVHHEPQTHSCAFFAVLTGATSHAAHAAAPTRRVTAPLSPLSLRNLPQSTGTSKTSTSSAA